jgi:glycosyltransferase involved in cell wall biosynthesis
MENSKNKILFIAPLPPAYNGQTKVSQAVLEILNSDENNIVTVVNSIKKGLINGIDSFERIIIVLGILKKIWQNRKDKDVIYLSLTQSTSGNIKDLITYCMCYKSLDKIVLHMLGGAGMKRILNRENLISRVNKYFHKKVKAIIVEGDQNFELFAQYVDAEKIHIVPNFVDEFIFTDTQSIKSKFQSVEKINLLFLSNLLPGKGHLELANAFIEIEAGVRDNFTLTFVGGFPDTTSEKEFLKLISPHKSISYLGHFIDGKAKAELYAKSHAFCLPTYYPYEGQPISILEGYASGMVVMTTNHSGIPTIFKDKTNGYLVETQSKDAIKEVLKKILEERNTLVDIAISNFEEAKDKYEINRYKNKLYQIILKSHKICISIVSYQYLKEILSIFALS